MKFWHIAVKDLKVRVRDKSAFVVLLILPMVMIIILGTVFNWAGSSFTANVTLVDLDRGDMARRLTQDVFGSPQLRDLLVVTTVSSEAEARSLVEQGKTGAAVIIPAGFSSSMPAGTKVSIIVLGNPETATQAGVIRNVVESFTAEVQRRQLAASIAIRTLQESGAVPPQRMQEAIQSVLHEVGISQQTEPVSLRTTTQEGLKVPRALDYYAVGMALLYLIFTANTGTDGMLEEKRQHTLPRILATPTSRVQVLLGKLVGIFAIAALQFAMIIVLTRVLYGVNWGASVPAVIVMATATVLAGAGLSTMVAALARTPEQAGEIGPAVALIYSLLGGSMWAVYNMPAWMNSVSRLTFTRWSIEGFTSLMVNGGGVSSILRPVGVCLAMAAVFLLISVTVLNRNYQ
ncbi:MAG: ABC transporter permease [Caldiserica bacterium]|nr:ABC transporter permease [Caldisericota bacterium]